MKRPFGGTYKTYDPKTEGYGSPGQWRSAFAARMGKEEAEEVLRAKGRGPWAVLGVPEGSPWKTIKSAYRRLSMACHPDRAALNNMSRDEATERFKELAAAYVLIDDEYTRRGKK